MDSNSNPMLMDLQEYKIENEQRWADTGVSIQKIKDKLHEHSVAIDKQAELIKDIQKLSTSVSVLANNMEAMLQEQRAQNTRLQVLENKPAKRWDAVVDKIIMLLVGGAVGYLLVRLGLQ